MTSARGDRRTSVAPGVGGPFIRTVLGHFATGITVITTLDDHGPAGFACQSFHALSLEPALVCFCVSRASVTWPRIRRAGRFAVNVLEARQESLCRTFALSGGEKFDRVSWTPSPLGSPVLDGVMAWVDCTVAAVHDGGDHHIVVGEVSDLQAHGGEPLIYFRGEYRQLP